MMDLPAQLSSLMDDPHARAIIDALEAEGAPAPPCPRCRCTIESAAAEAHALALTLAQLPASTLYAFGRRPHVFGRKSGAMTMMLVFMEAHRAGRRFRFDADAILDLLAALRSRQIGFYDVCRWLDDHEVVATGLEALRTMSAAVAEIH